MSWEKRFDRQLIDSVSVCLKYLDKSFNEVEKGKRDDILFKAGIMLLNEGLRDKQISFIRQLLKSQRKAMARDLKRDIGQLRQWLNERNSKDLLTNKDLETWLLNE